MKPTKAIRIKARDTQTTWPDPWSIVAIADNGYGSCSVHHQWTWDQN